MNEREVNLRRPLFDRLVDDEPRVDREPRPLRTLDRAGLEESVRRELELLFNTRSPSPAQRPSGYEQSVIDYGIPDLAAFSAGNPDHRAQLAEAMRRAAAFFEPRLHEIRIRLAPEPGRDASLGAQIEASVVIDGVPEPVSFEIVLERSSGKVRVDAAR